MNGIFISYRRDDSAGYAGRLYDRLAAHFGVERVFMDVEGIEPGTDFVDAIERAIASCRVLIVLIGDEWLSAADTGGRRRLDDPNDFIRLETSAALARDIRVVPVLLDGALMPHESDLPDNLKPLVRRQAVELTHKQWEASSGELIRTLERILSMDSAPAAAASTPPAFSPAIEQTAEIDATSGEAHHSKVWMVGFVVALVIAIGIALFLRDKPKPVPEPISETQPAPTLPIETPLPEVASVSEPSDPATAAPERAAPDAQAPDAESPPAPALRPASLETATRRLTFDDTETGQSTSMELRLTNTGEIDAPLNTRILGEWAGSYDIIADTCGRTLAPGADCSYTISFKAASAGARPAELLVDFGAATPLAVALDATAKAPEPAVPKAPPPALRPVIEKLTSTPIAGGAEICYRVEHADSLVLSPQPGAIGNSLADCLTVPLTGKTTLTLIATGQGGQASVRVAAQPASSPVAETPAPVAETPPPSDNADTRLPARGDTWTYRTRGKWATSPKRTIIFEVENVASGVITERYLEIAPRDSAGATKRSRAGDPAIIDWGAAGWEFSPWLAADDDISRGARLSGFASPPMDRTWGDWSTTASVKGKSQITVPAGTFAAVVVEASASRRPTGGRAQAMVEPVRVKFTVWYSPKVKRYVKMDRSVFSASRNEIEQDTFELVEYKTR